MRKPSHLDEKEIAFTLYNRCQSLALSCDVRNIAIEEIIIRGTVMRKSGPLVRQESSINSGFLHLCFRKSDDLISECARLVLHYSQYRTSC